VGSSGGSDRDARSVKAFSHSCELSPSNQQGISPSVERTYETKCPRLHRGTVRPPLASNARPRKPESKRYEARFKVLAKASPAANNCNCSAGTRRQLLSGTRSRQSRQAKAGALHFFRTAASASRNSDFGTAPLTREKRGCAQVSQICPVYGRIRFPSLTGRLELPARGAASERI
jgi:hypothetical protein